MKTIVNLLESPKSRKLGNHRSEILEDRNGFLTKEKYIYHNTCICEINHTDEVIVIDNGGYGTPSTTRSINAYLRSDRVRWFLDNRNYKLIDAR